MSTDPYNSLLDSLERTAPRQPRAPKPVSYDPIIEKHASAQGLDPDLLRSVIHQESGGRAGAISPVGAQGLMQLMPATAQRFGVTNPHDPDQNIGGGAKYLRFLLDRYQGDVPKALAGYNAGEGNVDKYKGIPPFRETRNYVRSITSNYKGTGYRQDAYDSLLTNLEQTTPAQQADPYNALLDQLESSPATSVPPQSPEAGTVAPTISQAQPASAGVPPPSPLGYLDETQERPEDFPNLQPPQKRPDIYTTAGRAQRDVRQQAETQGGALYRVPVGSGATPDAVKQAVGTIAKETDIPEQFVETWLKGKGLGLYEQGTQKPLESSPTGYAAIPTEMIGQMKRDYSASLSLPSRAVRNVSEVLSTQTPGEMLLGTARELKRPVTADPVTLTEADRAELAQSKQLTNEGQMGGEYERALVQPFETFSAGLGTTAGNLVNVLGRNLGINAVRDIGAYLQRRGEITQRKSQLRPEGEVPSLGPEIARYATGAGLSIAELVLLKRASGLPLPIIMAGESIARDMDKPAEVRAQNAVTAFGSGLLLDKTGALGRLPAAIAQTGLDVGQGVLAGDSAATIAAKGVGGAILGAGMGGGEHEAMREAIKPEGDPRVLGDLTRRAVPESTLASLPDIPIRTPEGVRVVKRADLASAEPGVSEAAPVAETLAAGPEAQAAPEPVRHVDLQKRDEVGQFREETPRERSARLRRVARESENVPRDVERVADTGGASAVEPTPAPVLSTQGQVARRGVVDIRPQEEAAAPVVAVGENLTPDGLLDIKTKEPWQMRRDDFVGKPNVVPTEGGTFGDFTDLVSSRRPVDPLTIRDIGKGYSVAIGRELPPPTSSRRGARTPNRPLTDGALLLHDGKVVGAFVGDTLAIRPEHRGKGLSRELFRTRLELGPIEGSNYSKAGVAAAQSAHKAFVKEALGAGKPVPTEVLKDYPDLAQNAPRPPTAQRSFPQSAEAAGLSKGTNLTYEVQADAPAVERASARIEAQGVDRVAADIARNREPSKDDVVAAQLLAKKYSEAGDYEREVAVINDLAEKLTKAGQSVQAASLISRLSPEGVLIQGQRLLNKRQANRTLTVEEATSLKETATRVREAEAKVSDLQRQIEEMKLRPQSGQKPARSRLETFEQRLTRLETEARARLEARKAAGAQGLAETVARIHGDEKGAVALNRGKRAVERIGEAEHPESGDVPSVNFDAGDLQDLRRTVTAETILKDYKGKDVDPSKYEVYQAYVPLSDIPKARLAGGRNAYGWEELQMSRGRDVPAVKLEVNSRGNIKIIDGNHRIEHWREQGYDYAPAWVIHDIRAGSGKPKDLGQSIFNYGGGRRETAAQQIEGAIETYIRRNLAPYIDESGNRIEGFNGRELPYTAGNPEREARLAHARAEFERQRPNLTIKRDREGVVRFYRKGQLGASTIPLDIADYAIIGAVKLAKKGVTVAKWTDEMVSEFGDEIKPHLRAIYQQSYAQLKTEREAARREAQERAARRDVPGPMRPEDVRRLVAERTQAQKDAQRARGDLERTFRNLSRTKTEKVAEAGTSFRRANLLTAAKTHLRNITSNTGFQGTEEASRPLAAVGDMIAKRKTGMRTTYGLNIPAVVRSTIAAGLTEGPARARDIMLGREVLPLEGYRPGAESMGSKMQLHESETGIKILDAYVNTVYRSLEAEDAVFKVYAFRRELADIARSQAEAERAKDSSVNVRERTRELQQNPTDAMLTEASAYADYATFQNKNAVSEAIAQGKRTLTEKAGPLPKFAIESIAPFDRTPTNIIARTIENSPAGFISAAMKYRRIGKRAAAEQLAGRIADEAFTRAEQKDFARTFGRASTGTILSVLGMALAHKGLLSGASDYDTDKKDYMEKRRKFGGGGMLKIPGTNQYVSIADTPVGKAMATAAAMYEQMTKKTDREKGDYTFDERLTGAGKAALNVLTDQPLIRGLRDMAGSASVGEGLGNYGASYVPGEAALKAAADVADPQARISRGQGIASPFRMLLPPQIPGGRGGLPVDTGIDTGERGGLGRRVLRGLDPFNTTTEGKGPQKREKSGRGSSRPSRPARASR